MDPVKILEQFGSLGLLALVLWIGMHQLVGQFSRVADEIHGMRTQLVAQSVLLLRLAKVSDDEIGKFLRGQAEASTAPKGV